MSNKDQLNKYINDAIQALGPAVNEKEIDLGDGPHKFLFRRLPFLDMDRLRLHAINPDTGKFDKDLHLGAPARLVSATLCDDAGTPLYSYDQVANMPTPIIDKLNVAAQEVNGLTAEAKAAIAKKSETTTSAVS